MNKGEFVETISQNSGVSKAVACRALDCVLANMANAMKNGEKVTLNGFGSFQVMDRKAHRGRNPQTGKAITIPARKIVKFRPAGKLKEKVR